MGSEVQTMKRIFNTLAIMVCALPGLVACQSGEEILAKMVAGPVPVEAFQPTVDSSRLIFVVPVDGMPDPGGCCMFSFWVGLRVWQRISM